MAHVFDWREAQVVLQLKDWLAPLGIGCVYSDGWSTPLLTSGTPPPGGRHAEQTLREQNRVLLKICPAARDRHWVVHSPVGGRREGVRGDYQLQWDMTENTYG